jgi:hypothetical protein
MQTPNKQIGASAQLMYTPTLLSQNVNQGKSSKAQTPISSSPVTKFTLQDPKNSNTNVIMSSASSSSSPPSNLSTPQLLSSFHNGSPNSIINNNNNANEISFVINIPDENGLLSVELLKVESLRSTLCLFEYGCSNML